MPLRRRGLRGLLVWALTDNVAACDFYRARGGKRTARGFERFAFEEIVSMTSVTNIRSQRVMQKLAMTRDPADDFDHPNVPDGHRIQRHVLYRVASP